VVNLSALSPNLDGAMVMDADGPAFLSFFLMSLARLMRPVVLSCSTLSRSYDEMRSRGDFEYMAMVAIENVV
jgi:hypothetical protein